MRTGLAFWTSGFLSVVSSFASRTFLSMSLPDPNATAPDPATAQLAGATDEVEKKRIELKSMLSTSFVASESQVMMAMKGSEALGKVRDETKDQEKRSAMATALMTLITDLPHGVVHPSDVENPVFGAQSPPPHRGRRCHCRSHPRCCS